MICMQLYSEIFTEQLIIQKVISNTVLKLNGFHYCSYELTLDVVIRLRKTCSSVLRKEMDVKYVSIILDLKARAFICGILENRDQEL